MPMFWSQPILRCICFLLLFMPLTGCWSKEEFNDRAFVTLMTVDRTKDGLTRLSIGFFLPNRLAPAQSQSMSKEKPFALVNREGRDLAEAFHLIQKDLPRKVTWGPIRVIIIGEAYAKHGIEPLLDFLLRVTDIRMRTYVFQINGKADILGSLTPIFERFPSEIIREFSHMELLPSTTIKDLMYARYNDSDTFLPQLYMATKIMESENGRPGNWLGTKGAVLIKKGKQVAELTPSQARGIQWMTNKIKNMILTFASPEDGKPVSLRISLDLEHHSTEVTDGRISVDLRLVITGDLLSTQSKVDLSLPQTIDMLEQAASGQIKAEIMDVWKQTFNQQADLFHISSQLKWKYPKLWNQIKTNWRSYYAEHTDVNIQVHMKLLRIGNLKQPVAGEG